MALTVGIIVGFTQGIILIFFETFVCNIMASDENAKLLCQENSYDPEKGFVALLFLNIVTIGPTLFFLFRLERIIISLKYRLWKS